MLNPLQNLESINKFSQEAEKAVNSSIFLEKLGGLTIFAGIFDFLVIQATRAIEQSIIKDDLENNRPIGSLINKTLRINGSPKELLDSDAPHENEWFYDKQVATREILNTAKSLIPNIPSTRTKLRDAIESMCSHGNGFLNSRNTVIHHIGNPKISREKMEQAVNNAVFEYIEFNKKFTIFRDEIHPFTFSEKEREKFYKGDSNKGLIIMGK